MRISSYIGNSLVIKFGGKLGVLFYGFVFSWISLCYAHVTLRMLLWTCVVFGIYVALRWFKVPAFFSVFYILFVQPRASIYFLLSSRLHLHIIYHKDMYCCLTTVEHIVFLQPFNGTVEMIESFVSVVKVEVLFHFLDIVGLGAVMLKTLLHYISVTI